MGWPVVLTRQAERDLEEIVRYVARDNPPAAERLGRVLYTRAQSLGEWPELGPKVLGWKNVRALLHRGYYVVYRPTSERIEVLRFWHSTRDLNAVRLD